MSLDQKIFHRKKIMTLAILCAMVLLFLFGRLVYLMIWRADYYSALATQLHERERSIKAARGRILDRNGVVLADNKTVCTISVIYSRERNPAVVMVAGMFHNDSFYYADSRGGLRKIFIEDGNITDTLVSTKSVIALARAGSEIVVATKENSDIVFYSCSNNDELTRLAEWNEADYIVNGSCLLSASTNKIACTVTSEQEIFEFSSVIFNAAKD